MSYQLPEIDLNDRLDLSPEQIRALHALVAYLCGRHRQKHVFKSATPLSDDDIRNFKHGRLRFVDAPNDVRLHALYKAVYEWFRDKEIPSDDHLYVSVIPLLDIVFPPIGGAGPVPGKGTREKVFGDAADALNKLFHVAPAALRELAEGLEGVYYLFRLGDGARSSPELAINAVRISLREVAGTPRLAFELRYKRRETGRSVDLGSNDGPKPSVYGAVIPHGDNVSLAGVDVGSGNSPTLCMLYSPARGIQEGAITGMMLRKNTAGRMVAARCMLVRAGIGAETTDRNAWERLFEEANSKVSIRTCEESALADLRLEPRPFSQVLSHVTNTIDNRTSFVLIDRLSRPALGVPAVLGTSEDEYDLTRLIPPPSRERISSSSTKILGDFLNIRYSLDAQLRLSFMTVAVSARYRDCLTFETIRYNRIGARIGKGLLYRVQSHWIADGIVTKHTFDFGMRRLSMLHQRQRAGKEMGDMLGVRLTVSPDDRAISAHKIYCYKLSDSDNPQAVKEKLQSPEHAKITEARFREEWPRVFEQVNAELISQTPHVLTIDGG